VKPGLRSNWRTAKRRFCRMEFIEAPPSGDLKEGVQQSGGQRDQATSLVDVWEVGMAVAGKCSVAN
jgi:hypothetical protein